MRPPTLPTTITAAAARAALSWNRTVVMPTTVGKMGPRQRAIHSKAPIATTLLPEANKRSSAPIRAPVSVPASNRWGGQIVLMKAASNLPPVKAIQNADRTSAAAGASREVVRVRKEAPEPPLPISVPTYKRSKPPNSHSNG